MLNRKFVEFPSPAREPEFVTSKPELRRLKIKDKIKETVKKMVEKAGLPGMVQDMEVDDEMLDLHISIKTSKFHTKLTIGNRDYTFDRLTGKLIGSGYLQCH